MMLKKYTKTLIRGFFEGSFIGCFMVGCAGVFMAKSSLFIFNEDDNVAIALCMMFSFLIMALGVMYLFGLLFYIFFWAFECISEDDARSNMRAHIYRNLRRGSGTEQESKWQFEEEDDNG